jgi:exoribonuclease-2
MIQPNSLVLYKSRPAIVRTIDDKLEIELDDHKTLKVRPKDVILLHPGPIRDFSQLLPQPGEVETAWELLAGETTTLPQLAELIFADFTPATAWDTWQLLDDGLYFRGAIDQIEVRLPEDVAQTRADRLARAQAQQQWQGLLDRVEARQIGPDDARYLSDVAAVACETQDKSRVMRDLGIPQTRENAHSLLLELGLWRETTNPYPQRMHLPTTSPALTLPDLPDEARRDLTHLPAFAIDDAGSTDPDDAIGLEGERLWVHIADVAALVPPNSPADIEARQRGASLYLPEGTVTMLPPQATAQLGLGLAEVSPALSFAVEFDTAGAPFLAEVVPSWVKVERLSYEQADDMLDSDSFRVLYQLSQKFTAQRLANGAIDLNLPEVKIRVKDGEVIIRPIPALKSRDMVRDAMLLAGVATARFAQEHHLPLLFSTQEAPDDSETFPDTMAGHFARRRTLKRSQLKSAPAPHAGLGLDAYAQTTSPLRRYADLVAHQQLRAFLRGAPLLTEAEVMERVGEAEAITSSVRQAERLANKHWTLVYLSRHPHWQGEGVLVELQHRRGRVLIPELDLETTLHLREDLPLDSRLHLSLNQVFLPELEAHFRALPL